IIEAVVSYPQVHVERAMAALAALGDRAERARDVERVGFGDLVAEKVGRGGLTLEGGKRACQLGAHRVEHGRGGAGLGAGGERHGAAEEEYQRNEPMHAQMWPRDPRLERAAPAITAHRWHCAPA